MSDTEHETCVVTCEQCGEFVVTYASFITPDFEINFCPACGMEVDR